MTTILEVPAKFKDSCELLTEAGFKTSNVWYHGTTSGLTENILKKGLKRSGDHDINQATKSAMATIGNNYTERKEPVFLTQSKELAYFWATQKVRARMIHVGKEETPALIEVTLDEKNNTNVKTDVGAVVMLLDLHPYMGHLEEIYKQQGIPFDLDAIQEGVTSIDRNDYLNKFGLAYYEKNIEPEALTIID